MLLVEYRQKTYLIVCDDKINQMIKESLWGKFCTGKGLGGTSMDWFQDSGGSRSRQLILPSIFFAEANVLFFMFVLKVEPE